MGKKFNVVGIGNAMVDILGHVTDETLQELGIGKGIMQLIDLERSKLLLRRLGDIKQTSRGSAANTIAGLSQLNISTAYIGKVKEDELGEVFAKDLKSIGAFYDTKMADPREVDETGRCIVMITPDGERSMNTYLGVTEHLSPNDIAASVSNMIGEVIGTISYLNALLCSESEVFFPVRAHTFFLDAVE